jgi:hypothetical protein
VAPHLSILLLATKGVQSAWEPVSRQKRTSPVAQPQLKRMQQRGRVWVPLELHRIASCNRGR